MPFVYEEYEATEVSLALVGENLNLATLNLRDGGAELSIVSQHRDIIELIVSRTRDDMLVAPRLFLSDSVYLGMVKFMWKEGPAIIDVTAIIAGLKSYPGPMVRLKYSEAFGKTIKIYGLEIATAQRFVSDYRIKWTLDGGNMNEIVTNLSFLGDIADAPDEMWLKLNETDVIQLYRG